jgi:hypothetical protein
MNNIPNAERGRTARQQQLFDIAKGGMSQGLAGVHPTGGVSGVVLLFIDRIIREVGQ